MVEAVADLKLPPRADRRLQDLMDRNNDGAAHAGGAAELESWVELSETMRPRPGPGVRLDADAQSIPKSTDRSTSSARWLKPNPPGIRRLRPCDDPRGMPSQPSVPSASCGRGHARVRPPDFIAIDMAGSSPSSTTPASTSSSEAGLRDHVSAGRIGGTSMSLPRPRHRRPLSPRVVCLTHCPPETGVRYNSTIGDQTVVGPSGPPARP